MRRFIALAGVLMALAVPGTAFASDTESPNAAASGLTKNQRIATDALDAYRAALSRYATYLSTHPAKVAALEARVTCVIDRIIQGGVYYANFDSLPDLVKLKVSYPLQFSYWFGFMYRLMPATKGKFSARAVKGIFLNAANRARDLNPNLTGERIIRGLRAQASLIDLYRGLPDVRLCAILDDWGTNGFDLDRLDPVTSKYTVIVLRFDSSNAQDLIAAAITAMKTVPGVDPNEAQTFSRKLIDDPFESIALPLAP